MFPPKLCIVFCSPLRKGQSPLLGGAGQRPGPAPRLRGSCQAGTRVSARTPQAPAGGPAARSRPVRLRERSTRRTLRPARARPPPDLSRRWAGRRPSRGSCEPQNETFIHRCSLLIWLLLFCFQTVFTFFGFDVVFRPGPALDLPPDSSCCCCCCF